ncbi:MAG: aminotransferase class I/II-fold pyridoxal phosphate-dependent enzyme [Clostridia bacterium]|nr:aminotransferase class I/II-fold pyridoxal phosphate-dependent enzyme [Clostridia bacterium]
MKAYRNMTHDELQAQYREVLEAYESLKARKMNLNMSRGKPGKEQLDLVFDMLQQPATIEDCFMDGMDVRNYGELNGLPSARHLFADILGTRDEEVFVGGNSSLALMFGLISKAYTHGLLHSERPWSREENVKFLCPSPGYDRHFRISQTFGMELITVPMLPTGPDMDMVEQLVKDETVKGMWCVPKYSNPDGIIYSDETIDRIARLKPAAPDFALVWDNAYCVHEFEGEFIPFLDMLSLCRAQGNADMVYEFASTSKITFPGAGISCMATSPENLAYLTKLIGTETIGFDKVNQLRHVLYLKDKEHTLALMKRHAEILGPKFRAVLDALEKEIAPLQIANWQRPTGGYFVSLNAMSGTAKRTLELCKQAGLVMTNAGATYPYGIDPQDSNIRIAPTLPPVEELCRALEIFCTCLKLSALEKLLEVA